LNITETWRFSLFGHNAGMTGKTDAKILTASLLEELEESTRMPSYYVEFVADEDYPAGPEI